MRLFTSACVLLLCACPGPVKGGRADSGAKADAGPGSDGGPGADAGASDAGADGGAGDAGTDGGPGALSCSSDKARVRVGEPANVTCTPPPGGGSPMVWSVSPGVGHVTDQGGGKGVYAAGVSDVDKSFKDTAVTITATSGALTGTATVTVIGDFWVGRGDSASIDAFASDGTLLGTAIGPAALDGTPRALALRSDGSVLVAQASGAPVVAIATDGTRLATFDATDFAGNPLFTGGAPPTAIAIDASGDVWVAGTATPAVFGAGGKFKASAPALPNNSASIGLALYQGEIAATFQNGLAIAFYSDASTLRKTVPLALDGNTYSNLGALSVDPAGQILAAVAHFASSDWYGTVLRFDATLAVSAELPTSAGAYRDVFSALYDGDGELDATPGFLNSVGACPFRLAADLSAKLGCLGAGTGTPQYRGIIHLQ